MRPGAVGQDLPVCGGPARRFRRAGRCGKYSGRCEEKPEAGSLNPLPNGDMQVKHLCKGKVP